MTKLILTIILVGLSVNAAESANKDKKAKRKITASEAIQLAEQFIIDNGYTDLPAAKDKKKIVPESVNPMTGEWGMQMRHDSLQRKAYGYSQGNRTAKDWTIVFKCKYKKEDAEIIPDYEARLRTAGRAVTMDAYGKKIKMEHQDIKLEFPGLVKLGN
jgi:hypothetical protein